MAIWQTVWNPYILENVDVHDCVCFWIIGEIVLLNFYFLMTLIYAYLCLTHIIFFIVIFFDSFRRIHLLIYTREPCLENIISYQHFLTTLLRVGVKKRKRKFSFSLNDIFYRSILFCCKYVSIKKHSNFCMLILQLTVLDAEAMLII